MCWNKLDNAHNITQYFTTSFTKYVSLTNGNSGQSAYDIQIWNITLQTFLPSNYQGHCNGYVISVGY